MATIGNEPNQPNLFELTGEYARILTYSTTSFAGPPQFFYRDQQREFSFTGDEIRSLDSEIGMLITVTLEVIDDHTLTLTLLLPKITTLGPGKESAFSTLAILTTHLTSIGGSPLTEGPLQTYEVMVLEGTAKSVDF